MTGKLEGKVALVTGGNSGIGLAAAKRFVAEGAHVFITGRQPAELEAAEKEIGSNVTGIQGDVAELADLDRLFAQIKLEKGKLDIVFANAGVAELAPVGEITEEQFDRIFDINVKGLLFTVQKALPLIPAGGFDHPERLDRGVQRQSGVERLQRDQGRGTIVRAHVDDGFEGTENPRERAQSGSDQHSRL